ncbi:MAG: UPF0182 family protein [Clostridia bacterium]|nr:UPF0182 family protein [Clostridia bacterium]
MKKIKVISITLFIVLALLITAGLLYGDFVEYGEIGYTSALFVDLTAKIGIYVSAFLVFAIILLINLVFIRKNLKKTNEQYAIEDHKGIVFLFTILAALFCALIIGGINYETVLLYLNRTPFGETDALFGKDISFYMFTLPFYELVSNIFSLAFLAGTIYSAILYFIYSLKGNLNSIKEKDGLITHIITDVLIFIGIKAFSLYIKGFEILFGSFTSNLTGAGMTSVYFWKTFYNVAPIILIVASALLIFFLIKRHKKPFVITLASVSALFFLFIVSSVVFQTLYVSPREVTAEAPYIVNNIEATKKAYGIDNIEEKIFNIEYNLTASDIKNNLSTVENIRITDNNATLTVANALQATRGYYSFGDVDILPYMINGEKRGISTAARELDINKLDSGSKSYINTRLRYTHGYGIIMSHINSVTEEGQPDFIVQDVPLKVTEEAPVIKVPQIYYGEFTNDYSIVNTEYNELDYMEDGETVETTYGGSGGILLTPLNKIYYSVKNADWMMLISGYINSDSRLLLNRNIITRAQKIAPYLLFDSDPYIIVNDSGRLIWVIDAYTLSDRYPYSQYYSGINYIRNSIKVTVDAYDGTVDFYITDETDPVAMTYKKIYPDVYKTGLPEDISSHIRYPEFLFKIQMEMYESYHVSDPETFYSKSDIWLTAREKYNNSQEKDVEPYYNIMHLKSEEETDMVLMLPFIPKAKQNLIAWVGVSSNYDTYGEMVVYKFPEGSPVNGTLQIENLISSDPDISEQISLWDQGDSNVMKGNLLVIPIENSIIYVEPLYITSGTESSIPQVKRILMAYGDRVVMAESLDEAFSMLFGEVASDYPSDIADGGGTDIDGDLEAIRKIYSEVKSAFESGDWALFGSKMEELEKTLGN